MMPRRKGKKRGRLPPPLFVEKKIDGDILFRRGKGFKRREKRGRGSRAPGREEKKERFPIDVRKKTRQRLLSRRRIWWLPDARRGRERKGLQLERKKNSNLRNIFFHALPKNRVQGRRAITVKRKEKKERGEMGIPWLHLIRKERQECYGDRKKEKGRPRNFFAKSEGRGKKEKSITSGEDLRFLVRYFE